MKLSNLLGNQVITESGWFLGRILDVRVERGPAAPTLLGFVVGIEGLRQRLLGEHERDDANTLSQTLVPWDAVLEIQQDRITVREIALPRR